MSNHEKNKSSKGLIVFIVIIVVIALAIGAYFLLRSKETVTTGGNSIQTSSVLNETITSENYEELTENVAQELGDTDELYYFTYATTYHIMQDGLASAFSENQDESTMYINIFGKTANDLIKEGKELMQENDITIDEFKESLKNLEDASNTINN